MINYHQPEKAMEYKPTFKHKLEYLGLRIIIFLLQLIPHRLALTLAGVAGKILWIIGIRRKVSQKNFQWGFRNKYSADERDKILSRSYSDFCKSMVEFARLPKIKNKIGKYIHIEGIERLHKLAEQNIGALLITGHFGSWELFGLALANAGIKLDILVGTQRNRLSDEFLIKYREKLGIGVIGVGVASRGILRSLKSGRMVAILADQDAGKSGIIIDFMGNPASTAPGTATFAMKMNSPIAVGYIVRNPDGITHSALVKEIIYPSLYNDYPDEIHHITQKFSDILAEGIEKYPSQYFWAHRKFKSTYSY